MKEHMPAYAKSELTPFGKLRVGVNLKASGLVAQAIERHGVLGVSVAP